MDIRKIPFYKYNTIIVGSGAAGLNAAVMLYKQGRKDIAVVTEGRLMGTSRNTGSDKQTYYRLTQCGKEPDSVWKMAKTLFDGGCMDGDLAMAEAAGSLRAFYHLVDIGVPFPFNQSGEFVGYKTDHDPLQRGTSAGPLTSRYMTVCLENQLKEYGIPVYDGYQAIRLFTRTDGETLRADGIMAVNKKAGDCLDENMFALFSSDNVIWATGGEAGMYETSVYPVSQTGGMGVLLEAGALAKNLTESQFGIASIQYRWNLSGTYQQCIPRYISTAQDGSDEQEFLSEYFTDPKELVTAIFLKGYQWPFDPKKIWNHGSSLIDLLVYQERELKGRRVYLDFMNNPQQLLQDGAVSFAHLTGEARTYLENSDGLQKTPYERLKHMNPEAIKVYSNHRIDLEKEYLEIAVCAQHNNGGISGNQWWETNIGHLFAIGEVNGTHGVYRPGGSALNSGQVGGIRASQYIVTHYPDPPLEQKDFLTRHKAEIQGEVSFGEASCLEQSGNVLDIRSEWNALGKRMTTFGGCIRTKEGIRQALEENRGQWNRIMKQHSLELPRQLKQLYKLKGLLISQYVYLLAMKDYDEKVGISRGSFLVYHPDGRIPDDKLRECFRTLNEATDTSVLQEISYNEKDGACSINWRPIRPLPEENTWFENIWKKFRENDIIK